MKTVNTRLRIVRLLSDGKLHSGSEIGRKLGVSRAAVQKSVRTLGANGLGVRAIAGVGYRLDAPITPLDRRLISREPNVREAATTRIEILERVDSTNRYLLDRALTDPDPSGMVCLAEVQPSGRGRRGRSWVATPYENLMMSLAWRFDSGPALVAGLSLAAGVAVARALEAYGVPDVGLKWPNDILWRERKLAGLLVDAHGEASGPCTVVVGVGVNCRISVADSRGIDQPWVDLHTIAEAIPDRNRLAALLIGEFREMFRTFAVSGLAAYQSDWNRRHLYTDRRVRVSRDQVSFEGTVEGIDEHGALRLRGADGSVRLFHSGEISLRSAA